MLDTFASVGVRYFDITHTNIDGEKRGFRPKQSLDRAKTSMPFLLNSTPRRRNNVIVRPHRPPAVLLIQLDDLTAPALERVAPVVFLILNTSSGNFQAWVAVDNPGQATDADFARRLRKGTGADPTASGATRVAGTLNFKRKYEPDFPQVSITASQPGRIVARAELEALIDWGWGIEDVAARLMEESSKAQENGERYAMMTATNAAAAVQRRRAGPEHL